MNQGESNIIKLICMNFFLHGATAPSGSERPYYRDFTIILRHIHAREGSSGQVISLLQRDLYFTTHNRKTSMPRWVSNLQFQQASGRRTTF